MYNQLFVSLKDCLEALGERAFSVYHTNTTSTQQDTAAGHSALFCNGTWDTVLCWPATPAGLTVRQPCPALPRGVDVTKLSYRRCGLDGRWEGRNASGSSLAAAAAELNGWTNYTECYTPESRWMFELLFENTSPQVMKRIALAARLLEIVGLSVSFIALTLSIIVFGCCRSLRCDRTRMHRNLFVSMLIHVVILLTVHIDQLVARYAGGDSEIAGVIHLTPQSQRTIYFTPAVCECLQAIVEYTKTVMFMWMFIEGFHLHNIVVLSVFTTSANYNIYCLVGWGVPLLFTVPWVVSNALVNKSSCWFMHTYQVQYWIIEGPRVGIIILNLCFLFRIVRELVMKLKQSMTPETVQAWKGTRAALVLLPLLGANNYLTMIHPPTGSAVSFGIWMMATLFLFSFQGFFVSVLYCFNNAEVCNVVLKRWRQWIARNEHVNERRTSPNSLGLRLATLHSNASNLATPVSARSHPE